MRLTRWILRLSCAKEVVVVLGGRIFVYLRSCLGSATSHFIVSWGGSLEIIDGNGGIDASLQVQALWWFE